MDVRFSITIRPHKSLRHLIEAIPERDWTLIPYWMDGAADVAETTCTLFQSVPDAAPVRLIVRRVKPTPGSHLALFATYSYHGFITDRDGETLELEADHRRHAEIENAIRDLKYGVGLNHMTSGRFAANGAWLAVQVMAHNLARWTARIGLAERTVTTKTLRWRVFALVGRITRSARTLYPASSPALALGNPVHSRHGPTATHSTHRLTASLQLTQLPRKLVAPRSARVPCCVFSRHPAHRSSRRGPLWPSAGAADRPPTSNLPQWSPAISPVAPSPTLPLSSRRPSVSFGGFGLILQPQIILGRIELLQEVGEVRWWQRTRTRWQRWPGVPQVSKESMGVLPDGFTVRNPGDGRWTI